MYEFGIIQATMQDIWNVYFFLLLLLFLLNMEKNDREEKRKENLNISNSKIGFKRKLIA